MTLRVLFLAVALAVLALVRAPATLVDQVVAGATDGHLRVLQAEGSIWNGRGVFASLSADGRSAQPWLSGEWRAGLEHLLTGRLGWRLAENGRDVLRIELHPGGIDIVEVAFDAPLKPLLDSVPHPVARAGWRGAVRLTSPGWACDWQRACTGTARFTWIDAGVELVPGRRFGDYELSATARGDNGTLEVRTLSGDLMVDGEGGWDAAGHPRFAGRVQGPPEIVSRLPNVMDGVAFPTDDPAVAEVVLR